MTTHFAGPSSSLDLSTLEDLQELINKIKKDSADREDGDSPSAAETVPLDEEKEDTAEVLTAADSSKFSNASEAGTNIMVKRKDFNHRGSDWNPITARKGTDTFRFTVPTGYQFSHHEVTPLKTTFPYELATVDAPAKGSTGSATLQVRWKLWGLGQVSYRLSGFCHVKGSAAPRVQVVIGSTGWDSRAAQLIAQKQSFRLVLTGPDAQRLWNDTLKFFTDNDPREIEPITDTVIITLAIITGVIALAGFATLAYVLTLATKEGCDSKASYNPGEGVAGTIAFDIGCR
jgi:hypothetical protein